MCETALWQTARDAFRDLKYRPLKAGQPTDRLQTGTDLSPVLIKKIGESIGGTFACLGFLATGCPLDFLRIPASANTAAIDRDQSERSDASASRMPIR